MPRACRAVRAGVAKRCREFGIIHIQHIGNVVKIYSNAEPVFDEDDVFRLVVPLDDEYSADRAFEGVLTQAAQETALKTKEKGVEKSVVKTVVKKEDEIVAILSDTPSEIKQQLAKATGLTVRGVEWNLKALKESGRIRRIGPGQRRALGGYRMNREPIRTISYPQK